MINVNNFNFIIDVLSPSTFSLYSVVGSKSISFASQTNPCVITSINHGLTTGNLIMIAGVQGMTQLNNLSYTITVIDMNTFSLNGIDATGFSPYTSGGTWYLSEDSTLFPAYTTGGIWSVFFADQRYLTLTIFTDPVYLIGQQSITCNITANRAAQVYGNQGPTNTVTVYFGHNLAPLEVIQFNNSAGQLQQRNVVSVTSTTVTFDGAPVTFLSGVYINQFFNIPFGKGFDSILPYTIATFIATITDPSTGINGLQIAINGDDTYPAAFLQIIEPTIIDSNSEFTIDYWYWQKINFTINPPFPGSANVIFQNSDRMENASMAAFNDVIIISNGWDFPQKYDGQTVYRAGMPLGIRPPLIADDTGSAILPFTTGNVYQYAITYEQIDNMGNVVEGQISAVNTYTVVAASASIDVTVNNLIPGVIGQNWNTNSAEATGGTSTPYGPDSNGFYYNPVAVDAGYTLKIGDSAYYGDTTAAVTSGVNADTFIINVGAGHAVVAGDNVYFVDSSGNYISRVVASVTSTSITIQGNQVTVTASTDILDYKVSKVFGDVGIVSGDQTNTNTITLVAGFSLALGDTIDFLDSFSRLQRRVITLVAGNVITISGIPVSVLNLTLIASENQLSTSITLQRSNANGATLAADSFISNNLRINIYRTLEGQSFTPTPSIPDTSNIYLVVSLPNNGLGPATQIYNDVTADAELADTATAQGNILTFPNPMPFPNPPPISKYLVAFGNQMFYAGGERNNDENSDRVYFSNANSPEEVPLATNNFIVPNVNDEISGIGVAGTSLVVGKDNSLWGVSGSFVANQLDALNIIQIAPLDAI
jgi:hypothetical protein